MKRLFTRYLRYRDGIEMKIDEICGLCVGASLLAKAADDGA